MENLFSPILTIFEYVWFLFKIFWKSKNFLLHKVFDKIPLTQNDWGYIFWSSVLVCFGGKPFLANLTFCNLEKIIIRKLILNDLSNAVSLWFSFFFHLHKMWNSIHKIMMGIVCGQNTLSPETRLIKFIRISRSDGRSRLFKMDPTNHANLISSHYYTAPYKVTSEKFFVPA